MTCREVAEFLMDYLDGALPAESIGTFERHLAICRECRDYLSSYQQTIAASRASHVQDETPCNEQLPKDLIKAILASRGASGSAAKSN